MCHGASTTIYFVIRVSSLRSSEGLPPESRAVVFVRSSHQCKCGGKWERQASGGGKVERGELLKQKNKE